MKKHLIAFIACLVLVVAMCLSPAGAIELQPRGARCPECGNTEIITRTPTGENFVEIVLCTENRARSYCDRYERTYLCKMECRACDYVDGVWIENDLFFKYHHHE